ncbi:N-acetylglucosamine-6-phosphate deacetylase [Virgibacillus phasianinus]|uniref:N-acetylglucosamine-6-phosphate deacetylase n=1 Tax=Virgibacillus phasianinus TaxID=2017483 RepID=A0A220U2M9_9BACI|nr:N-acetylglucosamine-6-phosphate deacetylase [Virgibacillus phasianinus]ASK62232.1 N-acetylglucosamine-6-phosphate deacetylase [Virgibacillus phasianinus]
MTTNKYYLKADRFLLENGEKSDAFLAVENGRFGDFVEKVPENAAVVDWSGYTIAPGLVDTHIHGINGYDIMDGTVEAVRGVSAALPALGVTRFLPTTLTAYEADLQKAIQAVVAAVNEGLSGAQSEGIFLEGPYFTEKHKGAQNPGYFRDPDYEEFQLWQELSQHTIVKIALAPERDGASDFIRKVSSKGVLASIAHTDAGYDRCKDALDAGARNFVHLFNGMSGLHHREPGVAGAALISKDAFAELICDGHHVHRDIASMVVGIKGDKTVLITDCMRAGLLPDGNYHLGEFPVVLKDGVARTETGSLAGSTLRLIDGVKKLHAWSGRPLSEIWHLASLSPAKSLARDNELGSLQTGKLADFVVMDDELNIQATAIEGKIAYQAGVES